MCSLIQKHSIAKKCVYNNWKNEEKKSRKLIVYKHCTPNKRNVIKCLYCRYTNLFSK